MILTCPHCSTRFFVVGTSLGAQGRKVKCGECEEIWFQSPDGDAPVEPPSDVSEPTTPPPAQDDNHFDIPESVRPSFDKPDTPFTKKTQKISLDKRALIAASAFFLCVTSFFIVAKNHVTLIYPASAALYQTIGLKTKIAGEGLSFDRVKVSFDDQKNLNITGYVLNLTSTTQGVPPIEFSLRGPDDMVLATQMLSPDSKTLLPEKDFAFVTQFPAKDIPAVGAVQGVQIRFVLSPKT